MKKILDDFLEVASFLGDEVNSKIISDLSMRYAENKFYLPVIGQFSAGKSKLINNLLNRNLLPVKTTETTSFITYIEYGDESVHLKLSDGTMKEISFEELLEKEQSFISKGLLKENEILSIHIKLKTDLLKNGLILVDTPGINTVFSKHEEFAYSILPSSQFLVYVMGKSQTKTDHIFLQKIGTLGIELIVVQTKIDEIKESEENLEGLIEENNRLFKDVWGSDARYFAVTNENELLNKPVWKDRFKSLSNYIKTELAENVKQSLERSINNRMSVIRGEFIGKLKEKAKQIQQINSIDKNELAEKIRILENSMNRTQLELSIMSKKTANNLSPVIADITSELRKLSADCIEEYERIISEFNDINSLEESSQRDGYRILSDFVVKANELVEKKTKTLTNDSNNICLETIAKLKDEISREMNFSIEFKSSEKDFLTLKTEKELREIKLREQLLELNSFCDSSDDELEKIGISRSEISQFIQNLENERILVKNDLNIIEPYKEKVKVIDEGDETISKLMGKAGNVLDWVLFFLPGSALTSGGSKIAKIIKKLGCSKKAIDKIRKIAKTMPVLDKIKDGLHLVKKTKDATGGIFDYLSLEYWFRKGGEFFDRPCKVGIDEEYKKIYFDRKNQLEKKYQECAKLEMDGLNKLALLKDEQIKLKRELEMKKRYQAQLEETLRQEEEEFRAKANKQAMKNFVMEAKSQFSGKISELKDLIIIELQKSFESLLDELVFSYSTEFLAKIENLKEEINLSLKMVNEKDDYFKSQQDLIERYNQLISFT